MVIEYKGYKVEVGFKDQEWADIEFGRLGMIYLKSDIFQCRSKTSVYYDSEIKTIQNIYIQYFKDKVNKLLGGEME